MAYVHIDQTAGKRSSGKEEKSCPRNRTCGPEERKESAGEIKKQQVAENEEEP